jgi:hypothetical protein
LGIAVDDQYTDDRLRLQWQIRTKLLGSHPNVRSAQERRGGRRYNHLILSMSARNLLNHTNPGLIAGDIVAAIWKGEGFSVNARNRRLEMQIRFTF